MVRHTGENFIDEEGVAVAPVLPLQAPGINGPEIDAPEADCFTADGDASFSQKILDIAVT